MNEKERKQIELDKSLVVLTETIEKIKSNLNTHSDDDWNDLFNKMSEARQQVDEIAEEARKIFTECLERVMDMSEISPTVMWNRDEYNNIVKNPNSRKRPPCEICMEGRKIEFCHIIPRQIGGSNRETNILYLCSTHHACFDSGVLTKDEWKSIDWRAKSDLANSFVNNVLLKRQEEYWKGNKVHVNLGYMGDVNLTEWVKSQTGCNSTDIWNAKRNNVFFRRTGKGSLG